MTVEIRLSDGTTLKTAPELEVAEVIKLLDRHLGTGGLVPIIDASGETYLVHSSSIVYLRDLG